MLDQVRLRAISHHSCASAWLQAIPSEPLSLTLSGQKFVVALRYWLGIPLFHGSARCSCGVVLDGHDDHIDILGCGYCPLRIRWHDAICDLLWHALVQDHSGCKKEQCCGAGLDCPGDVFHPDFQFGKSAYFDVPVHHPLQDSLLCLSAATTGVPARSEEADKDSHHEAAGGIYFYSFGGGNFSSLVAQWFGLRSVALCTTSKSSASLALAFCHFLEQLSVCFVEVQFPDVAPPPM